MNIRATAASPSTHFDGVDLAALAGRYGTPLYAYSASAIRQRIAGLQQALHGMDAMICYAVKANGNRAILELMEQAGLGADIVSSGELQRSLRAGIPPARIVFSGVGKRDDEIAAALAAGIQRFNVESLDELHAIERIAGAQGTTARAAVRINPDVDALTHAKISTGKSGNKFGVPISRAREVYARAAKLPGLKVTGTDMHIGSQITDLSRLETAYRILSDFVHVLRADGHSISHIDFGGGLGIPYHMDRAAPPAPDAYAAMVKRVTHNLGCTLMFEPGRMIVGNAGILVTKVIYVKHGDGKNFVIIDAAMNDLIRPTLYEAHHDILPVTQAGKDARTMVADVVGPVCETGDYLALDRTLPVPKVGDLLAIMTAGAYGAVQSGTYNTRPLIPEVLVKDDQYAVVRPRIDVDALIAMDKPAPWL